MHKQQTTATKAISHFIGHIKQGDQGIYEQLKTCLIRAKQADLKQMLEKEEENLATEMKEKHQETAQQTFDHNLRESIQIQDLLKKREEQRHLQKKIQYLSFDVNSRNRFQNTIRQNSWTS